MTKRIATKGHNEKGALAAPRYMDRPQMLTCVSCGQEFRDHGTVDPETGESWSKCASCDVRFSTPLQRQNERGLSRKSARRKQRDGA